MRCLKAQKFKGTKELANRFRCPQSGE